MTEQQTDYEMTSELDRARKLLVKEKQERATACWNEIEKVLKIHNCELMGTPNYVSLGDGIHATAVKIWVSARED